MREATGGAVLAVLDAVPAQRAIRMTDDGEGAIVRHCGAVGFRGDANLAQHLGLAAAIADDAHVRGRTDDGALVRRQRDSTIGIADALQGIERQAVDDGRLRAVPPVGEFIDDQRVTLGGGDIGWAGGGGLQFQLIDVERERYGGGCRAAIVFEVDRAGIGRDIEAEHGARLAIDRAVAEIEGAGGSEDFGAIVVDIRCAIGVQCADRRLQRGVGQRLAFRQGREIDHAIQPGADEIRHAARLVRRAGCGQTPAHDAVLRARLTLLRAEHERRVGDSHHVRPAA